MRREQLVVGVVFALCCVLFLVRDRIAAGGLLSSSASSAALRGGDTDWEPDLSASPALLCNGVLKWGEARGILSSSVACADIDVGGGVVIGGLVATKNISEKEVVMSVPKGSLVGAWAVHGSRLAKPARELGGAIDSVSLSILFLLNEVHVRQSSWTPYLRYLWSLNVNPAYMWSDAKLAEEGSIYLRKEVAKERADIREAYEKLFPLLSTKYPSVFAGRRAPYFSLEKFTKAWAIFHTRNWFLPLGGKVNHAFMAPVIDMLNYPPSLGGSTYVDYNEETFSFELIATKEIKAGEEVYFYYGKYCKDKALLTYGFSLPKMKDRCT